MIDLPNYEVVSYSAATGNSTGSEFELPNFDDVYSLYINAHGDVPKSQPEPDFWTWIHDGVAYQYTISHNLNKHVDQSSLPAAHVLDCSFVHVFTLVRIGDHTLTDEESLQLGSCEYALLNNPPIHAQGGRWWYYRIGDKVTSAVASGSDIYFLYNFGETIFDRVLNMNSVLNFGINGYSLISLLTDCFLVYAGWCIVKWVVPL